jgi:hypothetical protein
MPVPDQVQDDGSGIQKPLNLLDSGSPLRCGRNDKFSCQVKEIKRTERSDYRKSSIFNLHSSISIQPCAAVDFIKKRFGCGYGGVAF